MFRYTPLQSLPVSVKFPEELAPRIRYDADARRLGFEGFMSKAVFDRLYPLSDDWDYKHAVEQLFQKCTYDAVQAEATTHASPMPYILGVAGAGSIAAIATVCWLLFHTS